MNKDMYMVTMTDSNGVKSVLGSVLGRNLDEANILLGKLVRDKHDQNTPHGLDLNGTIELIDSVGAPVGTSSVGEHILP
jgi:hypothetical protein